VIARPDTRTTQQIAHTNGSNMDADSFVAGIPAAPPIEGSS
jgi:hypothetical protein